MRFGKQFQSDGGSGLRHVATGQLREAGVATAIEE
jgi:hypothetical protein